MIVEADIAVSEGRSFLGLRAVRSFGGVVLLVVRAAGAASRLLARGMLCSAVGFGFVAGRADWLAFLGG